MRIKCLLLIVLLVLSSCGASFDYSSAYEEGRYQDIIDQSSVELASRLDDDALYYRMLSTYQLGDDRAALDAAMLYWAMNSKDADERLADSLRAVLARSQDPVIAVEAGRLLCSSDEAALFDRISYYTALARAGEEEEATALYEQIRPSLPAQTAALMCIAAGSPSTLIISNLEAWSSEEGTGEDFDAALVSALRLLIPRGDGELLLPLSIVAYQEGDSRLAMAIGDTYASIGDLGPAAAWWQRAASDYPEAVDGRLRAIRRT